MIAAADEALGNTTVKSPAVLVLSLPKSIAQSALLPFVELYRRQPRAVTVAVPKVSSAKSHTAVVPDKAGVTFVKAWPPAE